MKELPKSNKIKSFVVPKMTDPIIFLDKNVKSFVYTGRNIHKLYWCLEIIGSPTTWTTSGRCYHSFGPSSSINIDTETLQSVITSIHI